MRLSSGLIAFTKRPAAALVLLAVLYCVLNALKPVQIDDAAYYYDAKQIASHPLDPYGFDLLWYDVPSRANDILAPPLLPYSWALALDLVGDSPTLCKLVLLPWSLLLLFSLHALFHRFAEGWELALTAFTAFSPFLLPSLNLMLDLPALGLSLCAIHLFLRACDEDDCKRAVLAGLVAGLAIQTKYTGLVAPGVMLFAGILFWRWRLIPAALLTTAQVFICWELLIALCYGDSHFFIGLRQASGNSAATGFQERLAELLNDKGWLPAAFFTLVGGVTPALIVLGLAALGVRRRWLLLASLSIPGGLIAIAADDSRYTGPYHKYIGDAFANINVPWMCEFSDVVCFLFGVAALLVVGVAAQRLLLVRAPGTAESQETPRSKRAWHLTIFLLLWLGMETAGYFLMSPFGAVRRVLGVSVVLSLLTGRLVALSCRTPAQRKTIHAIIVGGVVLGFAYFALDFWNAKAQQVAADEAADWIQANGGGRVWYVGHWGFQYYAEHRNMRPLYWSKENPKLLLVNDLVVIPDLPHNQQNVPLDYGKLKEVHVVTRQDSIPLRTVPNFYGGTTALQHHEGPRLTVRIYRVTAPFYPLYNPNP